MLRFSRGKFSFQKFSKRPKTGLCQKLPLVCCILPCKVTPVQISNPASVTGFHIEILHFRGYIKFWNLSFRGGDCSFSTNERFSQKLTFLTPDTQCMRWYVWYVWEGNYFYSSLPFPTLHNTQTFSVQFCIWGNHVIFLIIAHLIIKLLPDLGIGINFNPILIQDDELVK